MEHGFPTQTIGPGYWIGLAVAGLLTVVPLVGIWLTCRKSQPRLSAGFWFFFCLIAIGVLSSVQQSFWTNWRAFTVTSTWLNGGFVVCVVAAVVCMFVSDVRSEHAGNRVILIRPCIGIVILAFFFLVWRQPGQRGIPLTASCRHNLKQIGFALHSYHEFHFRYPATQISSPPVSWRVQTMPFFDDSLESYWREYNQNASWDSPENAGLARRRAHWLQCPGRSRNHNRQAQSDSLGRYYTDYAMLVGPGAFSLPDRPMHGREITDGESNTLAVIEATGLNIVWTEPRDADLSQIPIGINLSGDDQVQSKGIGSSLHGSTTHALFADGAVKTLSEDIDPAVLKALTTIAGNDDVGEY